MIPQSLLLFSVHENAKCTPLILPHFFTERDNPWMRLFFQEFLRLKGYTYRKFKEHFQGKLPFESPKRKREFLFYFLLRISKEDPSKMPSLRAQVLRADLFLAAASFLEKPKTQELIKKWSHHYQVDEERLLEATFGDLPLERKLMFVPENLTVETLRLKTNLCLAQALLYRSSQVKIRGFGNMRRVIRQAKLRKLICNLTYGPSSQAHQEFQIEISGPLSIFRHTSIYGKSLAELLPLLSWCNHYQLNAVCQLRGTLGNLRLTSNDPIHPSQEPVQFDSKVEEQFAKDFMASTLDWHLVREPEPIFIVDQSRCCIFPDFKLQHRRILEKSWYLEIIGYWTIEYLKKKIQQLEAARIQNLILCINQTLWCGESQHELASLGRVILFHKKVAVEQVIQIISS